MRYFPINIDIKGKLVAVVGGGRVAQRKVRSLLKAGAEVRLISPEITDELKELVSTNSIGWTSRKYRHGDLYGAILAFVAADAEVGKRVAEDAVEQGIQVNVADVPSQCTFTLPSVVERDDLMITISTGGKCPALAKHMRKKLEKIIDGSYGELLGILGEVREKLLTGGVDSDRCTGLLNRLITSEILDLIKDGEVKRARELAYEIVSPAIGNASPVMGERAEGR